MKKTLTALRAFGCAKKHILSVIILSALMSNAYGDDPYTIKNEEMIVFGDCSLSDITKWVADSGEYVQFIKVTSLEKELEAITITVDEYAKLPDVGMMYFTGNCNFLFNALTTIEGAVPMIYVGDWYDQTPANLTLTFTKDAIDASLKDKEVSQKVEMPLISDSMFMRESTSTVSFTFGDATEGDTYYYKIDDDVTQPYKNVGIISPVALEANTAALLFEQGTWNPEQAFATGTFTVAFVGSEYIHVPEPATGTLSLLALAGLAARRRRK